MYANVFFTWLYCSNDRGICILTGWISIYLQIKSEQLTDFAKTSRYEKSKKKN